MNEITRHIFSLFANLPIIEINKIYKHIIISLKINKWNDKFHGNYYNRNHNKNCTVNWFVLQS